MGSIHADENMDDITSMSIEVAQNGLSLNEEISYLNENSSNNSIHLNGGTFEDIQSAINDCDDGGIIELEGSYDSAGNAIRINKNLVIKGNQNTILDAKNLSRFFLISGEHDCVINGLTFINSQVDVNDGLSAAIYNEYGSEGNYSIINCSFINMDKIIDCQFGNSTFCSILDCNFSNGINNYGSIISISLGIYLIVILLKIQVLLQYIMDYLLIQFF